MVSIVTTARYCSNAASLAESAKRVGFMHNTLVATTELALCPRHALILPRVYEPWSSWQPMENCTMERCQWRCGFRRVSILKFRAVKEVLEAGRNAFIVNSDWHFIKEPFTLLSHSFRNVDAAGFVDPSSLSMNAPPRPFVVAPCRRSSWRPMGRPR